MESGDSLRAEVKAAYEKTRGRLPTWELLPIDARYVLINVFFAGAFYGLRRLEQERNLDAAKIKEKQDKISSAGP